MTPEQERAAIVAWMRQGGFAWEWDRADIVTRLRAAWLGLRKPWAFATAGCKMAADAIERGDHHKVGNGE